MNNFFSQLVGQEQAIELLTQAVKQNRVAPAYLFAGPAGVGRSLVARCFIKCLFCTNLTETKAISSVHNRLQQGNHPDVLWVEPTYLHQGKRLSATEAAALGVKRKAPPQIRLEQVREIGQFLGRPPLEASRSIVVIEQAETMAEAAANGLLKTLEEPGKATLILIAPAAESLLPTLVSRCQKIPFYRLPRMQVEQVLKQIDRGEIVQNEAVMAIAAGSPGEAIASWEQLANIPDEIIQAAMQLLQRASSVSGTALLKDALDLARQIDKTLDTEAQLWLVDYLQHSYWQQNAGTRSSLPLQQLEKARQYLLNYAQPRLVWEVTLMAMVQAAVA